MRCSVCVCVCPVVQGSLSKSICCQVQFGQLLKRREFGYCWLVVYDRQTVFSFRRKGVVYVCQRRKTLPCFHVILAKMMMMIRCSTLTLFLSCCNFLTHVAQSWNVQCVCD